VLSFVSKTMGGEVYSKFPINEILSILKIC